MKKWTRLENLRIARTIMEYVNHSNEFINFEDVCQEVHKAPRTIEQVRDHVLEMLTNNEYMSSCDTTRRARIVYLLQIRLPDRFVNWLYSKGDVELDNLQRLTTFRLYEDETRVGNVDLVRKSILYFVAYLAKIETVPISDRYLARQYNKLKGNTFNVEQLVPFFGDCKHHIFDFPVTLSTQAKMAFITQVPVAISIRQKFRAYCHRMDVDEDKKITLYMSKNRLDIRTREDKILRCASEERTINEEVYESYQNIKLENTYFDVAGPLYSLAEVKTEGGETFSVPVLWEPKLEPNLLEPKQELTPEMSTPEAKTVLTSPDHMDYIAFLKVIYQGMGMLSADISRDIMVHLKIQITQADNKNVIETKRIKTSFEFALLKMKKFKTKSHKSTHDLPTILTFFSNVIRNLGSPQLSSFSEKIGKLEKFNKMNGYNRIPMTVAKQVFEYMMIACRPAR